jgi:hypothetical protein
MSPYIKCKVCGGERWPDHPKNCTLPCCKEPPAPIKVKQTQVAVAAPIKTQEPPAVLFLLAGHGFVFGLYTSIDAARAARTQVERDSARLTVSGAVPGYKPAIYEMIPNEAQWEIRGYAGMYGFRVPELGKAIE